MKCIPWNNDSQRCLSNRLRFSKYSLYLAGTDWLMTDCLVNARLYLREFSMFSRFMSWEFLMYRCLIGDIGSPPTTQENGRPEWFLEVADSRRPWNWRKCKMKSMIIAKIMTEWHIGEGKVNSGRWIVGGEEWGVKVVKFRVRGNVGRWARGLTQEPCDSSLDKDKAPYESEVHTWSSHISPW